MKQKSVIILLALCIIAFLALAISMAVGEDWENAKDRERQQQIFIIQHEATINIVKMAEMIRVSQLNDGVIDTSALTAVRNLEECIRQLDSIKTEKEMAKAGSINYQYWKHYVPTEIK